MTNFLALNSHNSDSGEAEINKTAQIFVAERTWKEFRKLESFVYRRPIINLFDMLSTYVSHFSKFRTLDVEPANLVGMTAAHNLARANVSPIATPSLPAMTWVNTIAIDAQNYANQCLFDHGGVGLGTTYGQNIFAAAGFVPTVADIVGTYWAGESVDYNFATNTCTPGQVCGHYTQVVWATSTNLGCGTKLCSINSPFGSAFPNWQVWVCNYNPPGNYGTRPYVSNLGTSAAPTARPSARPTARPTTTPTAIPTAIPTALPTITPTITPTTTPTAVPTDTPTSAPTDIPTAAPTDTPTAAPTSTPTKGPSKPPTRNPTRKPTRRPTRKPTIKPTAKPTFKPTTNPTATPTASPTSTLALTYTHEARKLVASHSYMLPRQAAHTIHTPTAYQTEVLVSVGLAIAILVIAVLVYMSRKLTYKACSGASDATMYGAESADVTVAYTDLPGKAHTVAMSTHTSTGLYFPCGEDKDRINNMCV